LLPHHLNILPIGFISPLSFIPASPRSKETDEEKNKRDQCHPFIRHSFANRIEKEIHKEPEAAQNQTLNERVQKLPALARLLPRLTPLFKHFGISESQAHPGNPFQRFRVPGAPGPALGPGIA
jgi:hypothetical protein